MRQAFLLTVFCQKKLLDSHPQGSLRAFLSFPNKSRNSAQYSLLYFPLLFITLVSAQQIRKQTRPVTVADSIEMTRLADGLYEIGSSSGDIAQWSPDRKHFTVVLKKGDVKHNTVDYSLELFDAEDDSNALPEPIVTLASSSNRPAINDVKWTSNTSIAFLGEAPGQLHSIYGLNLINKEVTRLVSWRTNIVAFDSTPDLQELVFIAESEESEAIFQSEHAQGEIVVSAQPLADLLGLANGPSILGEEGDLLFKSRDGGIRAIDSTIPLWGLEYPWDWWQLSLAPDGSHAILQTRVVDVPEEWIQYTNKDLQPFLQAQQPGPKWLFRYVLVDLIKGSAVPLLDSPNTNGNLPKYIWAPDGASIFASKVFLPLDISDRSEQTRRRERPFVAQIEIPSGSVVPVTDKDLSVVSWDQKSQELLLSPETSEERNTSFVRYKKEPDGWKRLESEKSSVLAQDTDVELKENITTPPRLVLERHKSGRANVRIELNPQFSSLRFAHAEVVRWQSSEGHEIEGGLYLPIDYVPGRKYPLVIQTHGFDRSRFYIDGPFSTAFAAEALTGRGFVVLQTALDLNRDRNSGPWADQKGTHAMAIYQGAIDYLNGRGLIDRNRVGLVGFSATCYGVLYTLTHSKYRFAAAIVSDGIDGGYFQYMLTANGYSPTADYFDLVNGAPPFGTGLQSWLENAPGFNMDKMHTPLRIEAIGNFSLIASWEWLAGLRRLSKPVELIWIRDGVHILQRPADRLISQQGTVDWFSFWLKPEENNHSHDGHNRWEQLRQLQKRDVDLDRSQQ